MNDVQNIGKKNEPKPMRKFPGVITFYPASVQKSCIHCSAGSGDYGVYMHCSDPCSIGHTYRAWNSI